MVDSVPERDDVDRSCFGFRVRSRCPFKFLRAGGGHDAIEVVEASKPITADESTLLAEWTLHDPIRAVTARLYRVNGIFHFWTNDAAWYRVDPVARVIEMSTCHDEIRREQRLWGVPTVLCFMERGDFGLHAAAVEVDGAAILLAAPGRHGKTTLALAFHRMGYRLLTEDTTCCRLESKPLLLPGPTSVRLRPDVFTGEPPVGTNIVSISNDRIHLVLDSNRAGDSVPVPLRALVFLRRAADEIIIEPVKASTALPDLWSLNFRLQTTIARSRSFSQLAQLASAVSLWNLHRPLAITNLDEVVSRIVETCR
jgi:hypothetical protein